MVKRYIFIFLLAWATTVFGQNPRLKQLEDCLHKQGYEIGYSQWNSASLSTIHNLTFTFGARGEEIINNQFYHVPDSIIPQRRQQLAIAIDSIHAAFTDLNKDEVESYLYRIRKDCADTIDYSIGFFEGRAKLETSHPLAGNRVWFINAREQAYFSYYKNCDDWDVGNYHHQYQSDNGAVRQTFDAPAFEAHIQPAFAVLKSLKGAAIYPVYWRYDKNYKESIAGGRFQMILGHEDGSQTGLVTGSHYFIPAQYKAETNALYQQLDSLTFDYLNRHPGQLHSYYTSSALPYATVSTSEYRTISAASFNSLHRIPLIKLQGRAYTINDDNYYFYFYMMEDGLHILSITSKGEGWMPKEWQKLKRWVNGKATYRKD